MSNVALYDPAGVVTNMVTEYLLSVNTPDYDNVPDKLVNPDVSGLSDVDRQYWKVDGSTVVEMSSGEKTSMDNYLKAKTIREKKYMVAVYDTNSILQTETWYDTTDGEGGYSGLAEGSTYVYSSTDLVSKTVVTYYYDGTTASTVIHTYFKNDLGQIIEKIQEV